MADGKGAIVVAVDGTSGSGKSSTSRQVAKEFDLRYLDTGAMYRGAAWWMLHNNVDVTDPSAIAAHVDALEIVSGTDPDDPTISVGDVDVSEAIREAVVTAAVSAVSAVPEIRARMVVLQRDAVAVACRESNGIVVEGRDIGTTVLPDARLKVYLTADTAARAARRALQDVQEGRSASEQAVAQSLQARDKADSHRKASPLVQADDAVAIDATDLTLDEVVAQVAALIRERFGIAT